jgi:hypothetical protein
LLYYLGVCLIVWLSVGFVMGLKFVYYDKKFTVEHIEKHRKGESLEDDDEDFNLIVKNKYTFLAITTLAGFLPLIADIYGTAKYR